MRKQSRSWTGIIVGVVTAALVVLGVVALNKVNEGEVDEQNNEPQVEQDEQQVQPVRTDGALVTVENLQFYIPKNFTAEERNSEVYTFYRAMSSATGYMVAELRVGTKTVMQPIDVSLEYYIADMSDCSKNAAYEEREINGNTWKATECRNDNGKYKEFAYAAFYGGRVYVIYLTTEFGREFDAYDDAVEMIGETLYFVDATAEWGGEE